MEATPPASSEYFPYTVRRRPLAPTHPLFEAGNLDRELLARERAPAVNECESLNTALYQHI